MSGFFLNIYRGREGTHCLARTKIVCLFFVAKTNLGKILKICDTFIEIVILNLFLLVVLALLFYSQGSVLFLPAGKVLELFPENCDQLVVYQAFATCWASCGSARYIIRLQFLWMISQTFSGLVWNCVLCRLSDVFFFLSRQLTNLNFLNSSELLEKILKPSLFLLSDPVIEPVCVEACRIFPFVLFFKHWSGTGAKFRIWP